MLHFVRSLPLLNISAVSVFSELLAATCGEVNNNGISNSKDTMVQQRQHGSVCHQGTTNRCQQCHQSAVAVPPHSKQPAVGVAAVAPACTSCRPGFLHPHTSQTPYQRILQQPWAGMTAATAAHYQQPALAAVPSGGSKHRGGGAVRAVEPGPEHAASSLHHVHVRRSVPWARTTSTGAVKRSRTCHAQEAPAPLPSTNSWVMQPQYLPTMTPVDMGSRTGWSTQQQQQQQQGNTKDTCGSVCKACCHTAAPPVAADPQQQQQTQWGSYYGVTGHCRGASEDGSRILWNNENMLRLFQV